MRSAALACVALLVALPALGQSFGANVGGAVTDETGALLPGAAVTITHALNGRKVVLTTGERGDYRAVALQPGDYDLSAERSGFAPATQRVTLLIGADVTMNFVLRIAAVESETIVTADLPPIERTRSQPSSMITKSELEELPVFGRNFLTLAQLLPGPAPATAPWADSR
jgi:hypothetical protein